MRNPLNNKVQVMKPSGIRKFFDIVSEMKDAISLGVGEPDFETPWHIREEAIYSLEKGRTVYTSNAGLKELKVEVCNYLKRRYGLDYPDKNVLVTIGGSEAIDLFLRSVLNPGDEVLIPEPCFVCYTPITRLAGGVPVPLTTKAENNFKLTLEDFRDKVTDRTKLIIIPFPNNPTGAIMTKEDLEPIAEFLRNTDIMVLSDEIYSELKAISETYRYGKIIREGIDTAIVGKPNVGKSTLMNLLAGCERSIVTDIAGTTRDIVEESVRLTIIIL